MTKVSFAVKTTWAGYEGALVFKFKKDAEAMILRMGLVRGSGIEDGKRFVDGKDLWNDAIYAEAEGDRKEGFRVCKFNDGPVAYLHTAE